MPGSNNDTDEDDDDEESAAAIMRCISANISRRITARSSAARSIDVRNWPRTIATHKRVTRNACNKRLSNGFDAKWYVDCYQDRAADSSQ